MEQPAPAPTDSTEISVPGPLEFIDLAAFRRIGGCGPLIRRDPASPLASSGPSHRHRHRHTPRLFIIFALHGIARLFLRDSKMSQ